MCPLCWWNHKLATFLRAWAKWIDKDHYGRPLNGSGD